MPRPKKELPNHAGGLYEVKITTGKTIDGKLIRKSFYSSISKEDARRQADQWRVGAEMGRSIQEAKCRQRHIHYHVFKYHYKAFKPILWASVAERYQAG